MTGSLFLSLFVASAAITSLLTQAIKITFGNAGKEASPNLIALINAFVVGGAGTIVAYILMSIPFNVTNIVYIILMIVTTWLGSTVGYDKVIQTLAQLKFIEK